MPWPMAITGALIFAAWGCLYLFFADHICDWQIKWLQSNGSRRFIRLAGIALMVFGLIFVWPFLVSDFKL
jgi:small neutral amino acid transporter SnatA (MarC family)